MFGSRAEGFLNLCVRARAMTKDLKVNMSNAGGNLALDIKVYGIPHASRNIFPTRR